jgi:hypothetical protein
MRSAPRSSLLRSSLLRSSLLRSSLLRSSVLRSASRPAVRLALPVCLAVALAAGCTTTPDVAPPKASSPAQKYLLALRGTSITTTGRQPVNFVHYTDRDLVRYGRAMCREPLDSTGADSVVGQLVSRHVLTRDQALYLKSAAERTLCRSHSRH